MAQETKTADGADSVMSLIERLAEMSHLTSLSALDALIGAAVAEAGGDNVEAARLAKTLADRLVRSTTDLQTSLKLQ